MATQRIHRLQLVLVGAADQDASAAFYEALGFERRVDAPFVAGRWIELYLPGGSDDATGVALVLGEDADRGTPTGILLDTDDIDAAHAELTAAGLDVDPEIGRPGNAVTKRLAGVEVTGPDPAMFFVRDPDGHSVLVVQPDAASASPTRT